MRTKPCNGWRLLLAAVLASWAVLFVVLHVAIALVKFIGDLPLWA